VVEVDFEAVALDITIFQKSCESLARQKGRKSEKREEMHPYPQAHNCVGRREGVARGGCIYLSGLPRKQCSGRSTRKFGKGEKKQPGREKTKTGENRPLKSSKKKKKEKRRKNGWWKG